ncbi:MAG TPA: AMP-binding protein [Ramlibacter sp.]|nr:AMP-binding protein [Ramlibacter sp.]
MKLGTLIAATARRFGDKPMAWCDGAVLTFAQAERRGNQLANALLDAGVRPGDRVLVHLPNSLGLVEAYAGIAKAGAVAVPAPTRLAPAEVAWLVEDAQPRAAFFGGAQRERLAAVPGDVLRVVTDGAPQGGEVALDALVAAGADRPPPELPLAQRHAVIGYTSGTTGRPKGAVTTHDSLVVQHLVNVMVQGLSEHDRMYASTPMAHRIGLSRLVAAWCSGSTVYMSPRFDPREALQVLRRERLTQFAGVATTVRMLLDALEQDGGALPDLRWVHAGGEAFPVPLKQKLRQLVPQAGLYTWYASTEAGIVATLRPDEQEAHGATVGRPNPGVELRLVQADGRAAPAGEAGEIVVRCGEPGRCTVMEGYFRNEAATREVLADGWYRTGDVGRLDGEGYLTIVDRVRDMIVSGGLNIYSREVEQCIGTLEGVADVAVVGVPDAQWGEAVVAFVEVRPGAQLSEQAVIEHCRDRIAAYKKPRQVRFVEALPRNSTGKVLKRVLRGS